MCYGYHIWSKEVLMQAENDDLDGGQRSSEVKWGKLCAMATIFGQKNCWCKLRMMMTFTKVKGHQRSNVVNYATKLGRKSSWCKFRMTVTFMEVTVHVLWNSLPPKKQPVQFFGTASQKTSGRHTLLVVSRKDLSHIYIHLNDSVFGIFIDSFLFWRFDLFGKAPYKKLFVCMYGGQRPTEVKYSE